MFSQPPRAAAPPDPVPDAAKPEPAPLARMVGPYRIVERLGEGPTGETFLAVDTIADRKIALKILHAEVICDPEKKRRFEEAARAVSALHHPNVPALVDIGDADGVSYIAREYAEGETVQSLMGRKRMRRRECVTYGQQIADALQASHSAGVPHGGIKGTNLVVHSGRVKVLDFGAARLTEGFEYTLNAQPRGATAESAAYLSPEQVEGKPYDLPADIFAFGSLLYQMATGRWAFKRDWMVATLDAILKEEPRPVTQISTRAPKGVDKIVQRCIAKEPHRRALIGEVLPLFRKLRADLESGAAQRTTLFTEKWEPVLRGVFIAIIVLALAGGYFLWRRARNRDQSVRTVLTRVTDSQGLDTEPAISVLGDQIAFASDRAGEGNLDIWTQTSDGKQLTRLTKDRADEHEAAFSPDGASIAFRSEREGGGVYLVSALGGEPRLLARNGRRPRFSPDGRSVAYWIGPPGASPYIEGASQIFVADASTGASRRLHAEFASASNPVWSTDGKHLLFLGRMDPDERRREAPEWWLSQLKPGAAEQTGACAKLRAAGLYDEGQCAIPSDWGAESVYFSRPSGEGANLYSIRLSPLQPQATESPKRVTAGSALELTPAATRDGRVLFSSQLLNADVWSIPVRANEARVSGEAKRMTQSPFSDAYPTLSADGRKMLFQSSRGGNLTAWMLEIPTGREIQVSNAKQDQFWPRISPDGNRYAFTESRIGAFEHFAAPLGVGTTDVICTNCGPVINDWSRDGSKVLMQTTNQGESVNAISLVAIGGVERQRLLQHPKNNLQQARFSADERWIVFVALGDRGHTRIYVAANRKTLVPATEWIAVTEGDHWDTAPQFSPDGKVIYFTSDRDGSRCVWARRMDPANGRPAGESFAVYHMHDARRSPSLVPLNALDLFVGADQILIGMGELSGSIWMAKPAQ